MSARLPVHLGWLLVLAWLGPMPAAARAQSADNPFTKAKVGQWAEYSATIAGQTMTMRQTLTAKDKKVATVKVELKVGPNAMGASKQEIPLDKPLDFAQLQRATSGAQARGKTDVKEINRGQETIDVGGKKYACTWVKFQSKTEVGAQKVEGTFTVWTSPEAPLSGLVRLQVENSLMQQNLVFELSGSGEK